MYSIPVHMEGFEKRKKSVGVIHVLAGCFILIVSLDIAKHNAFQHLVSLLPGFAIAIASIVYGLFRKKIDPSGKQNRYMRIFQFVAFSKLAVSVSDNSWEFICMLFWTAIAILLLFSERYLFADTTITLRKEGIRIPGVLSSQLIEWNTIQDVVIRNDYITIFREGNKYIQFESNANLPKEQLEEMHAFCTSLLQNRFKTTEIN